MLVRTRHLTFSVTSGHRRLFFFAFPQVNLSTCDAEKEIEACPPTTLVPLSRQRKSGKAKQHPQYKKPAIYLTMEVTDILTPRNPTLSFYLGISLGKWKMFKLVIFFTSLHKRNMFRIGAAKIWPPLSDVRRKRYQWWKFNERTFFPMEALRSSLRKNWRGAISFFHDPLF